jgi:hypothetical protein
MGGSVQWRRKNAGNGGKKPEVPKTALEQLRSRFGGKFVDDIKGPHAEGVARGIIAAADYFGDGLVDGARVYNKGDGVRVGQYGLMLGQADVVGSEVWVAENEMEGAYERRELNSVVVGQDVEGTAMQTTTHELTHIAVNKYATQEIRDYNKIVEDLLAKNNISVADYSKSFDLRKRSKIVLDLVSKGMDPVDAFDAVSATANALNAADAFCERVVKDAKNGSGYGRLQDFQSAISSYAAASYQEAVSEAYGDWFANGNLAHPNSVRIVHSYEKLRN